ncbi:DNA-3-methyladenine glycosylase I [Cribrihabitans marinus]|uniref:DNA-3-methyladenine glycosylase I n=1 Tax=Cribrihabitans marinus TaxID=1227549 RepID=A0A1H6QUY1_9RHOB|nr:DNA-3-methyladenine glycosylase I [Cribrihabitans marinus]GGH18826.1 DNA-3-methyladenine glycosylase I [Cribrihabitans marinus]SEI42772.1 DNA-3-methyladenine glycosylase I [Cribrihabitans marinus]
MSATVTGPDGRPRCGWCGTIPEFFGYHDREWGWPVADDRRLFEKLCLESFQSGLSWRTILNKRPAFRAAFHGFDPQRVAAMDASDVERLLQDRAIIRHRGKIEAVIGNARRLPDLIAQNGSFAAYVWRYEPDPAILPAPQSRTTSPESEAMAKDLKARGWRFVGPTTIFAFMQSMGLINDHATGCILRAQVSAARRDFVRPAP